MIGTGATYVVQEADEGATIEVVATATNDNSTTATEYSAPTATVIDAAPTVIKKLAKWLVKMGYDPDAEDALG